MKREKPHSWVNGECSRCGIRVTWAGADGSCLVLHRTERAKRNRGQKRRPVKLTFDLDHPVDRIILSLLGRAPIRQHAKKCT